MKIKMVLYPPMNFKKYLRSLVYLLIDRGSKINGKIDRDHDGLVDYVIF